MRIVYHPEDDDPHFKKLSIFNLSQNILYVAAEQRIRKRRPTIWTEDIFNVIPYVSLKVPKQCRKCLWLFPNKICYGVTLILPSYYFFNMVLIFRDHDGNLRLIYRKVSQRNCIKRKDTRSSPSDFSPDRNFSYCQHCQINFNFIIRTFDVINQGLTPSYRLFLM